MTEVEINHPETLAEIEAVFARYEAALVANDVAILDELFFPTAATIRYGVAENQYGIEEVRAFRLTPPSQALERELDRTVITSYGRDMAVASTLFRRTGAPGKVGRQTQTWIRTGAGWRVVAAHVSVIDEPAA